MDEAMAESNKEYIIPLLSPPTVEFFCIARLSMVRLFSNQAAELLKLLNTFFFILKRLLAN